MFKKKRGGNWHCTDCGIHTGDINEYYMIKDEVWNTVANQFEMLCIRCLEQRLGRYLVSTDFLDCPLNEKGFCTKSLRLQDRLGHLEKRNLLL